AAERLVASAESGRIAPRALDGSEGNPLPGAMPTVNQLSPSAKQHRQMSVMSLLRGQWARGLEPFQGRNACRRGHGSPSTAAVSALLLFAANDRPPLPKGRWRRTLLAENGPRAGAVGAEPVLLVVE